MQTLTASCYSVSILVCTSMWKGKGHDLQYLFQIITLNHNILCSSFRGLWGHMVNMAALSSLLSYTVMLLHIFCVNYGNLPMPAGNVRLRELVSGGATLFFCFFLLKFDKMLEGIFFHRYLHLLGRR